MMNFDRRSLLGAAAGLSLGAAFPASASPKIGKPAPNFTVHTFDRRKFALADLKGKVIVLNYWATWCGPCRRELPLIDAYVRQFGGDDLKVFAVTTEDSVPDAQLKPLAKVLSFPLASRIDSWSYGLIDNAVPTNYVIDRAGTLRYAAANAFSAEAFDAVVTPLLNEDPPEAPASTTAL